MKSIEYHQRYPHPWRKSQYPLGAKAVRLHQSLRKDPHASLLLLIPPIERRQVQTRRHNIHVVILWRFLEDTVCDYDGQVEQHAGNPLRMLCETLAPRHEGVENGCWIGLVGRLECHGGNDSRVCGAGCAERRAVDAISRSISRHRDQDHVQDASFVSNSAEALLFPVNIEPFAQDQLMNNRV